MVPCPKCQATTKVIETREDKRVRVCERGHKFETMEQFQRWVPKSAQRYFRSPSISGNYGANPFDVLNAYRAQAPAGTAVPGMTQEKR